MQILTPATEEKETEDTTEALAPEGSVSTEKQIIGEAASTNLSGEIAEQVSVSDSPKDEEVVQNQTDDVIAKDEEQIQTRTTETEIPSAGSLKEKESGPIPDKNGSITSSGEEPDVSSSQKTKGFKLGFLFFQSFSFNSCFYNFCLRNLYFSVQNVNLKP